MRDLGTVEDLEASLRDAGLRLTRQRKAILKTLQAITRQPDASEIFQRVLDINNRVSLATAYRTMRALEAVAVIRMPLLLAPLDSTLRRAAEAAS